MPKLTSLIAGTRCTIAGCRPRNMLAGALLLAVPLPALADPGASGAPTATELANATYDGIDDQSVTLSNGRWEGQPYVEGGASRPIAGLVEGFRLTGDLNGDGSDEAVVMLWSGGGGSGVFSYIAAMGRRGDGTVNLGTAAVGDRVQLRGGHIADGRIVLDLVQQGPGDAACCPSQLATRSWTLNQGLREGEAKTTGTLSVAAIGGPDGNQQWQLTQLQAGQTLAAGVTITLRLNADKLVGSSGCNRYFAGVTDGDGPGDIAIGPIGGTRMACPGEAMTNEQRYLSALAATTRFSFLGGDLVLTGEQDEQLTVLRFAPQDSSD